MNILVIILGIYGVYSCFHILIKWFKIFIGKETTNTLYDVVSVAHFNLSLYLVRVFIEELL